MSAVEQKAEDRAVFSAEDLNDEILTRFRVTAFSGKVYGHAFRPVLNEEAEKMRERIRAGGKGMRGDAKDEAAVRAFFAAWKQIILRVEAYPGADGLTGAALHAYFETPNMAGIPEDKIERWRDMLRTHVVVAVSQFLANYRVESVPIE